MAPFTHSWRSSTIDTPRQDAWYYCWLMLIPTLMPLQFTSAMMRRATMSCRVSEQNPIQPSQSNANQTTRCQTDVRCSCGFRCNDEHQNINEIIICYIVTTLLQDILQPRFSTHTRVTLLSRCECSIYASVKRDGIKLDYRPSFVLHSSKVYFNI